MHTDSITWGEKDSQSPKSQLHTDFKKNKEWAKQWAASHAPTEEKNCRINPFVGQTVIYFNYTEPQSERRCSIPIEFNQPYMNFIKKSKSVWSVLEDMHKKNPARRTNEQE